LTNFNSSFAGRLSSKYAVNWSLKILPQSQTLATLPLWILPFRGWYIYFSSGTVVMRLKCDEIFNDHFIDNQLLSVPVKQFRKSTNIWWSCNRNLVAYFWTTLYKSLCQTQHQSTFYIIDVNSVWITGCCSFILLISRTDDIINSQETVGDSLVELWISYNQIEKLKGINVLKKLKVCGIYWLNVT